MRLVKNSFLFILFLFFVAPAYSQVTKEDDQQQNLLEQQSQNTDAQGENYEDVDELSNTIQLHPINLDKASESELEQLVEIGVLSDLQLQSLISYRKYFGRFISVFEIQAIPYFDLNTINGLLPFIKVTGELSAVNASTKEILTQGDYMFLFRGQQTLETSKGFSPVDTAANDTNRYLGSPQKIYARFRYNYGTKLSYGITAKKDAGEELFKVTQPNGFDFYSAHFYYRGSKWMKALGLGDYTLSFGQGLVMCGGFGIGKSAQVLSVKKGGREIKPYTSSNEVNFFRGVATTIGTKHLSFTPFFSYKKLDANIAFVDTVSDEIIITSFGGDGYHRTYTELTHKGASKQTTMGGNLNYHQRNFNAGVTAIQNSLNVNEVLQRAYPYNQFSLNSAIMKNASFDYSWRLSNLQLFGEAAVSGNGGKALLQGLQMSLTPKADLSLVYRNYSKEYLAPFAQGFAESSTPNNENGLYAGVTVRPTRMLTLDAYADFFNKKWLDYQVDAPSYGTDYFAQATYSPKKYVTMYVRYRDKNKQVNNNDPESHIDYLIWQRKQNLRFNLTYKVNQLISFQSRVEAVRFKEGTGDYTKGVLFLQDINFKKSGVPLSVTARYSIFDTDSYDTRIYAFESDVLYSYSIPAFQGKGIRWYLLLRYTLNKHIDIWARFAQTSYLNQTTISSGMDAINSNHKSEVKVEMRLRF
ncbi:MAG: hypothetical protein WCI97_00860 [Bacteroidota bacterium]